MPKPKTLAIAAAALVGATALVALTPSGRKAQFVLGGAMINAGYRLQDHLESYDFVPEHEHAEPSPEEIWQEMLAQNQMAAAVRTSFPRTPRHPLVALVVCMDARLDTNELTGDTRKYYYVVRTAGSVLEQKEAEMLELAVENGVRLIVLTTHTDCAAERAARTDELRRRFPALTRAVDERERRIHELMQRPALKSRIEAGTLAIKVMDVDTRTERLQPR